MAWVANEPTALLWLDFGFYCILKYMCIIVPSQDGTFMWCLCSAGYKLARQFFYLCANTHLIFFGEISSARA